MQATYTVYVHTDERGRVTGMNSSAFLPVSTPEGWIRIDEGTGDRYHHTQDNELDKPIVDERGVWRYKLADGMIAERTQAEMDAEQTHPVVVPTPEARMGNVEVGQAACETIINDIWPCMADVIGGAPNGGFVV